MGGSTYVALFCIAAVQALVVLAAVRYGARKALAKVEETTALTAERAERIETHLGIDPDDEPAIDPVAESADRSGFFAPSLSEGMDCR